MAILAHGAPAGHVVTGGKRRQGDAVINRLNHQMRIVKSDFRPVRRADKGKPDQPRAAAEPHLDAVRRGGEPRPVRRRERGQRRMRHHRR